MPASRAIELADRLSSRSKIGRAVVALGTLIITSLVLPAGMNTSLCTRGTPGSTLPSSAISENPEGGVVAGATATPVCAPTIDGTCMRRPALTRRTSTVPVTGALLEPGAAANSEAEEFVLSKARPLNRRSEEHTSELQSRVDLV